MRRRAASISTLTPETLCGAAHHERWHVTEEEYSGTYFTL